MRGIPGLFFSLLVSSVFLSINAHAANKKLPKKGVLLKPEGYYVTLGKADSYKVKKTGKAIAEAQAEGFISAEQYFQTQKNSCVDTPVGPRIMQPSEVLNFTFALKSEGDKSVTSKIRFSKGIYKFTLECFNKAGTSLHALGAALPILEIYSSDATRSEVREITEANDVNLEIRDRPGYVSAIEFCTDGKLTVERLS